MRPWLLLGDETRPQMVRDKALVSQRRPDETARLCDVSPNSCIHRRGGPHYLWLHCVILRARGLNLSKRSRNANR